MHRRPRAPKHSPVIKRSAPDVPVPPDCDPDSVVLRFPVPHELDGQRLDRFVEWRIPRLSRIRAAQIVEACARRDDGSRRRPSDRVRSGEHVILVRERFVEPPTPMEFGVLYQDEAVTAVDKPAGLPVHPSATYHRNTLTSLMRQRFGPEGPHLCHRLDRETSGVVVCASRGPDEVAVKRQFAGRGVEKEYLAIVRGLVSVDVQSVSLPMRRVTEGLHMKMEVHPDGLPAFTEVVVLEHRGAHTKVLLRPRTGRQHQLRVHLSAIGHPIVGDKLYGPDGGDSFLAWAEFGMTEQLLGRFGHHRHALHAHRCAIDHPRTGERLSFEAPLSADLEALWASFEP